MLNFRICQQRSNPSPRSTRRSYKFYVIVLFWLLADLSEATLLGALRVPAADAAERRPEEIKNGPVIIDARGIEIDTREFQISLSRSGVTVDIPFFPR